MFVLSIHDKTEKGQLSFDLKDILFILGSDFLSREWVISQVECFGSGAKDLMQAVAEAPFGRLILDGHRLLQIATKEVLQFSEGLFVCISKGLNPEEIILPEHWSGVLFPFNLTDLAIRAEDSSFFEVFAHDKKVIDLMKSNFHDVRDQDPFNYHLPCDT